MLITIVIDQAKHISQEELAKNILIHESESINMRKVHLEHYFIFNRHYLLFPTVTCSDDAFIDLGDDRLGTSIRHQPLDQSVTSLELLLNALELDTFYDMNRRVDRGNFNGSEIMEKDEDLTSQMSWKILTVLTTRSLSCHHLSPLESISARELFHILWEAYL